MTFFSADGVVPEQAPDQGPGVWGVLGDLPRRRRAVVTYLALLIGSLMLTVGLFTRVSAIVVLVALIGFARRDSLVLNSGDGLIRNLVLFTALAPAGAALSLDRLRTAKDTFWEFPKRSPWALRLIQIQVSVLYLSTVWQKVRGVNWNDGTAVPTPSDRGPGAVPAPGGITHSIQISSLATYGTLLWSSRWGCWSGTRC